MKDEIKDLGQEMLHPTRIWTPSGIEQQDRMVAREIPLALTYNCKSHAVMMVTPLDLEDYVYGFSLTEGIIEKKEDILDLHFEQSDKGMVADIEITPECFSRLEEFKRIMVGRSGCGLCGVDRLEHAIRPLNPVDSSLKLSPALIHQSMQKLGDLQSLNKSTGALHAAAFVNEDGEILAVREDLGRHNALDKMIGHLMRESVDPATGFALITSRCSFEMVHKCATFGIPLLAAVSATTGLALELAQQADLTLVAFVRDQGINIYCDPKDRLSND